MLYLVDYISGSTAYLYPYADRADSPRVAGKAVTVPAASITNRVQIATPSGGVAQVADMPAADASGNYYGYMDFMFTRTGSTSGTFATYHEIDTSNRWEFNLSTGTTANLRLQERTSSGGATIRLSVSQQIANDTPYQIGCRFDASGHTLFRNGVQIGSYGTVGSFPTEATAKAGAVSGMAVSSVYLYPLVVEIISVPSASLAVGKNAPTLRVSDNRRVSVPTATVLVKPPNAPPVVRVSDNKQVVVAPASLSVSKTAPAILVSDHKRISLPTAALTVGKTAPAIRVSDNKRVYVPTANLTVGKAAPAVLVSDHKRVLVPSPAVVVGKFNPTVLVSDNKRVAVPTAAVQLAAITPTVRASDHKVVPVPAASLSVGKAAPVVRVIDHKRVVVPTTALNVGAYAPGVVLSDQKKIGVPTAALVVGASPPLVKVSDHKRVSVPTAVLVVTGVAPSMGASDRRTITPPSAALTLSAIAPTVRVSSNIRVAPAPAGLILGSVAPQVRASDNSRVSVLVAGLEVTARAPEVRRSDHTRVSVPAAALALSPQPVVVKVSDNRRVMVPAAALSLSPVAPAVRASSNVRVGVAPAALSIGAPAPTVRVSLNVTVYLVAPAVLTLTATSPEVFVDYGDAPDYVLGSAYSNVALESVYQTSYRLSGDYVPLYTIGGGVGQNIPDGESPWIAGDSKKIRIEGIEDNDGQPFDFTGATVKFVIFTEPPIEKATGSGVTTGPGVIDVTFIPSDTEEVEAGGYDYECEVRKGGNVRTEAQGKIRFTNQLIKGV